MLIIIIIITKLMIKKPLSLVSLCGNQKISVRFRLETATETETNEVDVKPNFSVFELFSVLTLKP